MKRPATPESLRLRVRALRASTEELPRSVDAEELLLAVGTAELVARRYEDTGRAEDRRKAETMAGLAAQLLLLARIQVSQRVVRIGGIQ